MAFFANMIFACTFTISALIICLILADIDLQGESPSHLGGGHSSAALVFLHEHN